MLGKILLAPALVLQPFEINNVCGGISSIGWRAIRPAAIRATLGAEGSVTSGAIINGGTIKRRAALLKECAKCIALPNGAASYTQVDLVRFAQLRFHFRK